MKKRQIVKQIFLVALALMTVLSFAACSKKEVKSDVAQLIAAAKTEMANVKQDFEKAKTEAAKIEKDLAADLNAGLEKVEDGIKKAEAALDPDLDKVVEKAKEALAQLKTDLTAVKAEAAKVENNLAEAVHTIIEDIEDGIKKVEAALEKK